MTGQDAVNVANGFLEYVQLTGIVLSKLDGDARGGAAIGARPTGSPIKFAGEKLDDFEGSTPTAWPSRILGMGDVLTLIEKAEQTWDAQKAEKLADKMRTASFTFDDFLDQFQAVRRMGSLDQVVAMLPGAGSLLRNVEVSDRDVGRVEAIIRSMTPDERQPQADQRRRKRRIARGRVPRRRRSTGCSAVRRDPAAHEDGGGGPHTPSPGCSAASVASAIC